MPIKYIFLLLVSVDQALDALGLKTGGTIQQRAERLLLTKVTYAPIF